MDVKFGWQNAGKAVMTILGFAVFVYSTSRDYFDFPNFKGWKTYGLLFAAALFIGAILRHFLDLQIALNDRMPNIDINGLPVLDDVRMDMNIQEPKGIFHVTGVSHMSHIAFANSPKRRTYTDDEFWIPFMAKVIKAGVIVWKHLIEVFEGKLLHGRFLGHFRNLLSPASITNVQRVFKGYSP